MSARALLALCLVILGANPGLADAFTECLGSGNATERLRACDAVIASDGSSLKQISQAHIQRGRIYAEAGAHRNAIEDFDAAIVIAPADISAFEKRALSRLVVGRLDDAVSDLTFALKRRPNSSHLWLERGYVHLVAKRPDAAISDFNRVLALQPRHAVALNNRGLAYRKKGDLERARADYTAAIALAPTYALALTNRGYAFEAEGRKQEAVADFRRALNYDPKLRGAIAGLARLGVKRAAAVTSKRIKQGYRLAQTLCIRCHSIGRGGESANNEAPAFRDLHRRYPLLALRAPIKRSIAAPHDQMPKFELTESDIDKILAYVNSLRN
jgi:tetratricopeptide (TPR) repeat protein